MEEEDEDEEDEEEETEFPSEILFRFRLGMLLSFSTRIKRKAVSGLQ